MNYDRRNEFVDHIFGKYPESFFLYETGCVRDLDVSGYFWRESDGRRTTVSNKKIFDSNRHDILSIGYGNPNDNGRYDEWYLVVPKDIDWNAERKEFYGE